MPTVSHPELNQLIELSIRVGKNPMLVQAATGNTSIKIDGTLWIKASGKWLAHTGEGENFVPLSLAKVRNLVQTNSLCPEYLGRSCNGLSASIETAMHATLPHRVVIHVHSVNAIAWAVRRDALDHLPERLSGVPWKWIPYVASGLPLARAIGNTLTTRADVFILANHGLVVAGDSCAEVSQLLDEVERRLAVSPRPAPPADPERLAGYARTGQWVLPSSDDPHMLGTDPVARRIIAKGTLYPCHAIFIGPAAAVVRNNDSLHETIEGYVDCYGVQPSLAVVKNAGVLVSQNMSQASAQVLYGLSQVARRLDETAPIRYLDRAEVADLLNPETMNYRDLVENRARVQTTA